MPGFTLTKLVDTPIADTFAACTDVEHAAGRIKDIVRVEMLTPGPVGLGTKFKETRIVFKREATETMEFTAYEPDRLYELTANSCGAWYRTEFRFAPDGAGTRIDVTFSVTAVSFWARLFAPLARLMMGTIRQCLEKDLDDVARHLANTKRSV